MQLLKSSKLLGASISFAALSLIGSAGNAQMTVTMSGVSAVVPAKGETQSLNVSQGQRTSLSVGNGVSLGTSAQFTSSIGSVSVSRSVLQPTSVALESSIGGGTVLGRTDINIENITANSNGGNIQSEGGSNMEVGADSKFASGKALIDGMTASSKVLVDTTLPAGEGKGVAEYYATANPQVRIGDSDPFYRDLLTYAADVIDGNGNIVARKGEPILDAQGNKQYTGDILTRDANGNLNDPDGASSESGVAVMKGSDETDSDYWESVNACTPTASNGCIYEEADALKTGNASANSSYQTSTNIDINSNAFTNVFGQAF